MHSRSHALISRSVFHAHRKVGPCALAREEVGKVDVALHLRRAEEGLYLPLIRGLPKPLVDECHLLQKDWQSAARVVAVQHGEHLAEDTRHVLGSG